MSTPSLCPRCGTAVAHAPSAGLPLCAQCRARDPIDNTTREPDFQAYQQEQRALSAFDSATASEGRRFGAVPPTDLQAWFQGGFYVVAGIGAAVFLLVTVPGNFPWFMLVAGPGFFVLVGLVVGLRIRARVRAYQAWTASRKALREELRARLRATPVGPASQGVVLDQEWAAEEEAHRAQGRGSLPRRGGGLGWLVLGLVGLAGSVCLTVFLVQLDPVGKLREIGDAAGKADSQLGQLLLGLVWVVLLFLVLTLLALVVGGLVLMGVGVSRWWQREAAASSYARARARYEERCASLERGHGRSQP
jgi:hypothetical protein